MTFYRKKGDEEGVLDYPGSLGICNGGGEDDGPVEDDDEEVNEEEVVDDE